VLCGLVDTYYSSSKTLVPIYKTTTKNKTVTLGLTIFGPHGNIFDGCHLVAFSISTSIQIFQSNTAVYLL
jgi:hypothetical protein